jgi:hypothetical protein
VMQRRKRVLIWKDFKEWEPALEGMYADVLTAERQAKIRQSPRSVEDAEDHVGCQQLMGRSLDDIIASEKIDEFRRLYSHIRVFPEVTLCGRDEGTDTPETGVPASTEYLSLSKLLVIEVAGSAGVHISHQTFLRAASLP